jgi:hypothetical protein
MQSSQGASRRLRRSALMPPGLYDGNDTNLMRPISYPGVPQDSIEACLKGQYSHVASQIRHVDVLSPHVVFRRMRGTPTSHLRYQ